MTTLIIDRSNGVISSDSRASWSETKRFFSISSGMPKIKKITTSRHSDDTTKIFNVGGLVICGCGSLDLLQEVVALVKSKGEGLFPKAFYVKSQCDLSETTIYLTKRVLGECHTLRLDLKSSKILGTNYQRVKVEKWVPKNEYTLAGSGWQFAAGALEGGQDNIGSIEVAKKFDRGTGGYVQQVLL